jgi:2-keto-4-pentenoate hydratase
MYSSGLPKSHGSVADGLELHAGDVIMPGALCAMVPVARGDVASAKFGILGTVSVRFG